MSVAIRARKSDGYDIIKSNTNAGYGYVYAWAELIDYETNNEADQIYDFDDFFFEKVKHLYGWLENKNDDVQNGAIDALMTLEQSNWKYARDIMNAEIAIIGDLGIDIESEYV